MGSTLYSSLIFTMWKVLASQSSGGTHRKYFLELSCARVQSGFVHFIFIKETCSVPLRNKVCLLWLCWMSCFLWTDAPAVHSSFLWDTVGQNFEEEIGFWLRVCVSDCLKFFFFFFFLFFFCLLLVTMLLTFSTVLFYYVLPLFGLCILNDVACCLALYNIPIKSICMFICLKEINYWNPPTIH